jgi:hypothetical protein
LPRAGPSLIPCVAACDGNCARHGSAECESSTGSPQPGYDVFTARPKLGALDAVVIAGHALVWRAWRRVIPERADWNSLTQP